MSSKSIYYKNNPYSFISCQRTSDYLKSFYEKYNNGDKFKEMYNSCNDGELYFNDKGIKILEGCYGRISDISITDPEFYKFIRANNLNLGKGIFCLIHIDD